jgi:hypothetical protein
LDLFHEQAAASGASPEDVYVALVAWAGSRETLGRLFLGYVESAREEGQWLMAKDIIAWCAESIESVLVTEEQLDEQLELAEATVQWTIEENWISLTVKGLEVKRRSTDLDHHRIADGKDHDDHLDTDTDDGHFAIDWMAR